MLLLLLLLQDLLRLLRRPERERGPPGRAHRRPPRVRDRVHALKCWTLRFWMAASLLTASEDVACSFLQMPDSTKAESLIIDGGMQNFGRFVEAK